MTLRRWNVRHVREVLDTAKDFAPFPASGSADHVALKTRLGDDVIAQLLAAATTDLSAPIPDLPASLYHEFRETGRRGRASLVPTLFPFVCHDDWSFLQGRSPH